MLCILDMHGNVEIEVFFMVGRLELDRGVDM